MTSRFSTGTGSRSEGSSTPPASWEPLGPADVLATAIRRNTAVLAGCLALSWSVVQLAAALGAVTLSELTGEKAIAGLAPGLFLLGWALAGPPAGRFMDARGRASGIRLAFLIGSLAGFVVYVGSARSTVPVFLGGITLMGAAAGAVNLARAGGADMYPPERRARGISFVLVGAALGAILGPIAFAPLLSGIHHDPVGLARPWLVAVAIMAGGTALTLAVRPDPIHIGQRLSPRRASSEVLPEPRPLRALIMVPTVGVALVAAVAAQSVMSATMSIVGLTLVDHGHDLRSVSFTLSIHFLGMFALVLVVGRLVDRVGRLRSIGAGLVILAAGDALLGAGGHLVTIIPAMFAIGVGWNVAFVAATALMADATDPRERARLLGFADFASMGVAAPATIAAGAVLEAAGLFVLAAIGTVLALAPLVLLFLGARSGVRPLAGP